MRVLSAFGVLILLSRASVGVVIKKLSTMVDHIGHDWMV